MSTVNGHVQVATQTGCSWGKENPGAAWLRFSRTQRSARRAQSSSGNRRWLTRCPGLCVVRTSLLGSDILLLLQFLGSQEPLFHLTIDRCPGVECIHFIFSNSLGQICLLLLRLTVCLQPSIHPKTFTLLLPQSTAVPREAVIAHLGAVCVASIHLCFLHPVKDGRDRTGSPSGL